MPKTSESLQKLCLGAVVAMLALFAGAPSAMANDTGCVGVLTRAHDNVVAAGADCLLVGADVTGNVSIESAAFSPRGPRSAATLTSR